MHCVLTMRPSVGRRRELPGGGGSYAYACTPLNPKVLAMKKTSMEPRWKYFHFQLDYGTGNHFQLGNIPAGKAHFQLETTNGNFVFPAGNLGFPAVFPAGNVDFPAAFPAGRDFQFHNPAGNAKFPAEFPAGNPGFPAAFPAGNLGFPAAFPAGNLEFPASISLGFGYIPRWNPPSQLVFGIISMNLQLSFK